MTQPPAFSRRPAANQSERAGTEVASTILSGKVTALNVYFSIKIYSTAVLQ